MYVYICTHVLNKLFVEMKDMVYNKVQFSANLKDIN